MMKKLLLLSSAFFALSFGASAQTWVTTPTLVTDTLTYFLHKMEYKMGIPMNETSPYYKAPASAAVNSVTYVTHCGSIFRNKDTALWVTGVEGYCAKNTRNFAGSTEGIPVHLYLCNLGANGMPVLPAVDSIVTNVINNCPGGVYCPPQLVGGNFANPRKISGDFAVLIRNYSDHAGDTVRMFRTPTLTHDSQVLTGTGSEDFKVGEGLGVMRKNLVFTSTANYLGATGFGGFGTDYEFCVAPRVKFELQVSQQQPANAASACILDVLSYTNTSSPEFTNKQFNLNEFWRQMKPFRQAPPGDMGFSPDTVMQWDFGDDPRLDTMPHLWGRVQNQFLAANTTYVNKAFDTVGIFMNGMQVGSYRKMNATYFGLIRSTTTFSSVIDQCGKPTTTGIVPQKNLDNVSIYPNPAANGKTTITGLNGKNTIQVINILGQLVSTEVTDKQTVSVDLSKQPAGTYTIRITNPANSTKTVKIINPKD